MAPEGTAYGQPWNEKYRPKVITDVSHQDAVVSTLQEAMKSNNVPHLLFYGPPGTGKTTTALAMVQQLFGPTLVKSRVMELNASDERGINVVRHKIKQFAATAVGQGAPGFPSPPYKVIILDESDSMTTDAQNALRRTMELYTKVTRFVLICNYVSRIIEPIASRCAKFRFKPLGEESISDRITSICQKEGVVMEEGAMEALGSACGGDMRKAISHLQSAVRLFGNTVSVQSILEAAGVVPPERVVELLEVCRGGSFEKAQDVVVRLTKDGYPALQIMQQMQDLVMCANDVSDDKKARICMRLAEVDKALIDGSDEMLQLLDFASLAICVFTGTTQLGKYDA